MQRYIKFPNKQQSGLKKVRHALPSATSGAISISIGHRKHKEGNPKQSE